jgi:hypothetical protein
LRTITFLATLPDIVSAISLPGSDDIAARIKLDVPPSGLPGVVALKTYGAGKVLRVTVEVEEPGLGKPPPEEGEYTAILD